MAIGEPGLIPFGVLGAVILDLDLLFHLFSAKRPRLYMFIHGGAAHSIAGAVCVAVMAFGALCIIVPAGEQFLHFTSPFPLNTFALTAVLAGALLHVSLDFLASPGIPLFWPWNDTKYTFGVFAGPSAVMIFISWTFILLYIAGIVQISGLIFYGILFLVYLFISLAIRLAASVSITGRTLPTINPLRWLAIEKSQNTRSLKFVNILTGSESGTRTWPANRGVTEEEIIRTAKIQEVRRVRYNSYFTIADRKDNGDIVIQDPARVERIIRYPPYYTKVTLTQDGPEWKPVPE
jgi:inner membrane protein